MVKRRRTKARQFGASKREGHDSTEFYNSKLYQGLDQASNLHETENHIPETILDTFICQDSRKMEQLPNSSIHLMVTSPPYNVSKSYDNDLSLNEYLQLLKETFLETYRVIVNGGRACVNIANVGRKPYIPYHKYIIDIMQEIGFLMRGEIIWDKGASAGVSTAWGSWKSASNPTLRDVHEYILIFSKGKFKRERKGKVSTISKEEFLSFTKSVWTFSSESATRVGHPAPFPVELPYRCIQLYTFRGDVVLDPFCGVGTTAIACWKTGRHFVCYDNDSEYIRKSKERLKRYNDQ